MGERASSSSTCSSSSSPAGWFPSSMEGEAMKVCIRCHPYHGQVKLVDQDELLWSTVHYKTAKTCPTRFFIRDLAKLESKNRRSWSGDVTAIEDDPTHLWTTLQIRVPSAREDKILLKSANNVLVMVKPVVSLPGLSSQAEIRDFMQLKTIYSDKDGDEEEETRIRVGINGFSQVGRILVEMALQSFDVQVVAINDPSMSIDHMIRMWKSMNIGIAKKDDQTLVFEKRYYKLEGGKINILLKEMEVTVFREPNQVPWERVHADFVVYTDKVQISDKNESLISDKNESVNNCLRCLPYEMKMFSFELSVDERMIRPCFNRDNGDTAKRAARFSIITKSTAAANVINAVSTVFVDWDEQPTSLLFHATAAVDRSVDFDASSVDIKVTLEKDECCSDSKSIASRFCESGKVKKLKHRVVGIFSWCVDIVRCVPVGGCQLELI